MKNTIIIVIIVAIVAFTVGLYIGDTYGNGGIISGTKVIPKENGDYKDTFADGWAAAKNKLEESGVLVDMFAGEVKSLSGEITEISGNKIVFSTPLINPLDDESLKARTVLVTKDTEITIYKLKSEEEKAESQIETDKELGNLRFRRDSLAKKLEGCEMHMLSEEDPCAADREEFNDSQSRIMVLEMNMMGDYSEIKDAKIGDIEKDYNITVEAEEDISEKKEFKAVKIEVREKIAPVEIPVETPVETPVEEPVEESIEESIE